MQLSSFVLHDLSRYFRMPPLALLAFLWVLLPFALCQDDTCAINGKDGVNGVPGRDGLAGTMGEKGAPGKKVMCDIYPMSMGS